MKLKPYPAYKSVDGAWWLSEVPDQWGFFPGKRFFWKKKELNDGMRCENRLALTMSGVIPRSLDDLDGLQASEFETYQIFQEGDLVFKLIDLQNIKTSRVGLVPEEGIMSPAYIRLSPQNARVSTKFAYWYYTDLYNQTIFNQLGGGVRQTLAAEELLIVQVPEPTPEEQTTIATFLDRETTKLDTLIAKQEKLIELLQEKRQAVISHAVTKGLNPDAPMKDSGVEWLGEVPAHWEVKRLKHLAESIKAGPFGSALTKDMYVTEGYRVYGQEQVIPEDFSIGDYYISADKFLELKQYEVEAGDILISCVGTFGKIAVVPDHIESGIINPRLIRLRCNELISAQYFSLILRSEVVFEQFSFLSRGGTMDVINIGTLSEIYVAVPPTPEQILITENLSQETTKIDLLIEKAQRSIDLAKEHRTALISAAVTGKIDVREAA
jgi:type I restriction enzyme S subunit